MASGAHVLTLPGEMLRRGFWLYVWRVDAPKGEVLYVGRTGDNSSPHAAAPYTRFAQHLGSNKNQNALRRQLEHRGVNAEDCRRFQFFAYGPIEAEIAKVEGQSYDVRMASHKPLRDRVGALEKTLGNALRASGYDVLNTVKSKHEPDADSWAAVCMAFAAHFPRLEAIADRRNNER